VEHKYFEEMTRTLEFDPAAALKFSGGVRAFIMSASTIADLVDDLYLVLGEKFVDARLYLGGKRAGKRTAAALTTKFKIAPTDKKTCEQFFSDFYASLGWARIEFQLDYANRTGNVVAHNSFLAQGAVAKFTSRGNATAVDTKAAPRCAMLSGYIAGLVSFLLDLDVDVRESECVAMQAPECRFDVVHKQI
jgi:predicted hydrocarbon binding protein